ncbi:MAG: hypothetical protein COA99_18865, partial [Moraxellaceae bacterium]
MLIGLVSLTAVAGYHSNRESDKSAMVIKNLECQIRKSNQIQKWMREADRVKLGVENELNKFVNILAYISEDITQLDEKLKAG